MVLLDRGHEAVTGGAAAEDAITTTLTRKIRAQEVSARQDSVPPTGAAWASSPAPATTLAVSAYLTGACCRACSLHRMVSMALDLRVLISLRLGPTDLKILNRIALFKEMKVVRVTMMAVVEWSFMVHKIWVPADLTVWVWTSQVSTVRRQMAPWGTIMTAREIAGDEYD